jgi:hypothetical protein
LGGATYILYLWNLILPLYAVQRLADGCWLVRTQMGDPLWPAVDVVVVLDEPTSAAPRPARAARCTLPSEDQ